MREHRDDAQKLRLSLRSLLPHRARHAPAKSSLESQLRSCVDRGYLQPVDQINARSDQEDAVSLDKSIRLIASMSVICVTVQPIIEGRRLTTRARWLSVVLRDRGHMPVACTLFSLS